MAPDHDPDDERLGPDDPLPPEDRLWRHPSELAAGIGPPAAWFTGAPAVAPAGPSRRGMAVGALAGACLAGAVVAVGAMWIARPTRVEKGAVPMSTVRSVTTAALTFSPVPTERLAAAFGPSLPAVRVLHAGQWATGSGMWLDDHGTVLTATALIDGATEVLVTGKDGIARRATIAGIDSATGITALTVERTSGTPMTADVAPPRAGEPVAIVGATGVVTGDHAAAATTATAVVRVASMRSSVDGTVLHDTVQLDRTVPPDAVGGVLVDSDGRIVGINLGQATDGLGVVSPATDALAAGRSLRDHGTVPRAVLGVRATDLDPAAIAMLKVTGGAKLTEVTPGSPAASAGLEVGDVITKVDGHQVDDPSDLVLALRRLQPGDRVEVAVRHGDQTIPHQVTLGG